MSMGVSGIDNVYNLANKFEQIDVNTFYEDGEAEEKIAEEGITLTPKEKSLYDELIIYVKNKKPSTAHLLESRIANLNQLAIDIKKFPPLLVRHDVPTGTHSPDYFIESLIEHQDTTDATLRLPSKASLGKGYIISKIHSFNTFKKVSEQVGAPERLTQELKTETTLMMFTLMAEDVYLDLISDKTSPMEYRKEWALSLILLWEHRNDQTILSVAPVLQTVWTARSKLAPAFGTMMGTSELLLMSIQMDDTWIQFIKKKMGDADVIDAMEEFLFGISYEQIKQVRKDLIDKGIKAIDRNDVSSFLGDEHIKKDITSDYRDFYTLYTIRRDNARTRKRMKLPGPHQTLEDHFIKFVTQMNKEKQNKDVFATS